LKYYSAIRIPQALDNNKLKILVREGRYSPEGLVKREQIALNTLREWDRNQASSTDALEAVMEYAAPITIGKDDPETASEERQLLAVRTRAGETIEDRPWEKCGCPVCERVSVEVIIFRGSNRNKRRGIHNLAVYGEHIKSLRNSI